VPSARCSGAFFQTLGRPAAGGRLLGPGARADPDPAAVINETAARQLFRGEPALGKKISMDPPLALMPPEVLARLRASPVKSLTVVGIVRDVRSQGAAVPVAPEVFQSFAQAEDGLGGAMLAI